MKKVLIFILAFSVFAACKNEKNSKAKNSGSSQQNDDYRNSNDTKADKSSELNSNTDAGKENEESLSQSDDVGAGWSSTDENHFMNTCESTAKENVGAARANEYCDCMLQRMKKKYASYIAANRDLEGATQDEINKLAIPCNR